MKSNVRDAHLLNLGAALARIVAVMLLMPWAGFSQSAVSTFHTGAPPAWVDEVVPEAKTIAKADQDGGGQFFSLIDTQINADRGETFSHVVKEITSAGGVQNGANLSFAWDPSYQELTMHQITILRGTERLDRLDQQDSRSSSETDLSRQIYNGALSAVLFLEDVRVGDRVEYSYTVRGENPLVKNQYSETFLLGMSVPIQRRRVRFLWPEARVLNFKTYGLSIVPAVSSHDGMKEYVWDVHDVPAVRVEDQIPSWFTPYPWVQLSEFENWSEVSKWARQLFVSTNLDAPELKEEIAALRRPGSTPQETFARRAGFRASE